MCDIFKFYKRRTIMKNNTYIQPKIDILQLDTTDVISTSPEIDFPAIEF